MRLLILWQSEENQLCFESGHDKRRVYYGGYGWITAPPQYFPLNVSMNKSVNTSIDEILEKGTVALDVNTFKSMAGSRGRFGVGYRHQSKFCAGMFLVLLLLVSTEALRHG